MTFVGLCVELLGDRQVRRKQIKGLENRNEKAKNCGK